MLSATDNAFAVRKTVLMTDAQFIKLKAFGYFSHNTYSMFTIRNVMAGCCPIVSEGRERRMLAGGSAAKC